MRPKLNLREIVAAGDDLSAKKRQRDEAGCSGAGARRAMDAGLVALGTSALVVVLACNGNVAPPAPYHSSGNAGGPFVPKDGAAFFDQLAGQTHTVDVLMTDYTGACSMGLNSSRVSAGALRMFVSGADPVTAGMYAIDGMLYSATLTRWDAGCARTYENAASGNITLTTVTPTEVKGTFDLKFADGELQGDFDAPDCIPPLTDGGSVCVGADGG